MEKRFSAALLTIAGSNDMDTSKAPKGIAFLLLYALLSAGYSAGLIVWAYYGGPDYLVEILMLLIIPIFYSAYRYPRWNYLIALVICWCASFWALTLIVDRIVDSIRTMVVLSVVAIFTCEMIRLMRREHDRAEDALAKARDLNRQLEEEITERKQAEEAVRKEKRILDNVIHLNPFSISLYDRDGHFVSGNQAFQSLFGAVPPPDYSLFDDPILKREGLGDVLSDLKEGKAIKNLGPIWYDPRELYPDVPGKRVCTRGASFPILDEKGNTQYIVTVHEDCTQKKLVEERLHYRLAVDLAVADISKMFISADEPDLFVLLKRMSELVDASRAYILEYRRNEGKISCAHEYCAPGVPSQLEYVQDVELEMFPWFFSRLSAGENIVIADVERIPSEGMNEKEFLKARGTRAALFVPMYSAAGALWGAMIFSDTRKAREWLNEDIQALRVVAEMIMMYWDRKRLEAEEQRFQQRLKELSRISNELSTADCLDDLCRRAVEFGHERLGFERLGIWFVDDNDSGGLRGSFGINEIGELRDERGCRTTASEHGPFYKLCTSDHNTALYEDIMLRDMKGNDVKRGALAVGAMWDARRCIGVIYVDNLLRGEPITSKQCEILGLYATTVGYLCSLRRAQDEGRKLEQQLRQAQKMEAVGQLAGGVAHDFNNLLTGIIGNLSLMEEHATNTVREYISYAQSAADRAAKLVQQLLAFSRKSHLEFRPVDLNQVVDDVHHIARETIERRIDIVTRKQEDLPTVLADPAQISSVLMNLCLNSRDAIEEVIRGEVDTDRRAEHFAIIIQTESVDIDREYCESYAYARPGRFVVLTVQDNGGGMNADTRRHIFEPFFSTKEVGKGTGLGLASAYGIVKQHRGWITVSSEEGQGTTFRVYLPVSDRRSSPLREAAHTDLPRGDETVLLVDDEELIRGLGRSVLEELGYTVLLANDGQEAIETFRSKKERIDLVILDLSMPYLSGGEVLEELTSLAPGLKVIISSGYGEEDYKGLLDRFGVAAYVPKPYRPIELARVVRRVLDEKPDEEQGEE